MKWYKKQTRKNIKEEKNYDKYFIIKTPNTIPLPTKTTSMSYALRTTTGATEAVIDDNCGISKFYAIANTLADQLQVVFLNQVDDSDTLDWDFKYKNQFLTLHYNIFNGVSIFPQQVNSKKSDNKAVMEVAHFLERQTF